VIQERILVDMKRALEYRTLVVENVFHFPFQVEALRATRPNGSRPKVT